MSDDLWYSVREENIAESQGQGSLKSKKDKKDKFDSFKLIKKKNRSKEEVTPSTTLRNEILDELEEDPFGAPGFANQFPQPVQAEPISKLPSTTSSFDSNQRRLRNPSKQSSDPKSDQETVTTSHQKVSHENKGFGLSFFNESESEEEDVEISPSAHVVNARVTKEEHASDPLEPQKPRRLRNAREPRSKQDVEQQEDSGTPMGVSSTDSTSLMNMYEEAEAAEAAEAAELPPLPPVNPLHSLTAQAENHLKAQNTFANNRTKSGRQLDVSYLRNLAATQGTSDPYVLKKRERKPSILVVDDNEKEDEEEDVETGLETINVRSSANGQPMGLNVNVSRRVKSGVVNPNPGILKKHVEGEETHPHQKRTVSFHLKKKEKHTEEDSGTESDGTTSSSTNTESTSSRIDEDKKRDYPTSDSSVDPRFKLKKKERVRSDSKDSLPESSRPPIQRKKSLAQLSTQLFFRTTSIFRIKRVGNRDDAEKTDDEEDTKEQPFYANILFSSDVDPTTNDSFGTGTHFITTTKYLEHEYKQQLLGGYKTNDVFFFDENNKALFPKANNKALGYGSLLLFFMFVLVMIVFWWLVPNDKPHKFYNHEHVIVGLKGGIARCKYDRKCPDWCIPAIEDVEGCCVGCPLTGICNFPLILGWKDVNETSFSRQRVFVLVSTDGEYYYHTGWAPTIRNSSQLGPDNVTEVYYNNGTVTVMNGCFSTANQQIALIGCLSLYNVSNHGFWGFPADFCTSTWGICVNTNNVLQEDLPICKNGLWKGNFIDTDWEERMPPVWKPDPKKDKSIYGKQDDD